ncbi:MAG: DHHA1 domain-containing protein [Candidatus Aenigmatarchaeota archaeon]
MTFKPSYWSEPKKFEFVTEAKRVEDDRIILEETYFHPEEGGQPADKGMLNGYEVIDVQNEGGEIVHHVSSHDIEEGDDIKGEIDEGFRRYCMRAHTGAHVVFGAGREVMGKIDYSGFDIGDKKARIDFETDTHVDRKKLLKIEELCNKVILEGRPVTWKMLDREEIEKTEDIAFAKEMPHGEKVRVIEIEDWDTGVCSGTHLSSTLEVGRIHILGKKKLQEGVTRVNFSIGEEALRKDYGEKRSLMRASSLLETDHSNLSRKIRDMLDNLDSLEEEIKELEALRVEQRIEDSERYSREAHDLLVQTLEASTDHSDVISHKAKDGVGPREMLVLVNEDKSVSVTVGVGEDVEDVEANEVINELSQQFGGGGGGTSRFAQGGGFEASSAQIKGFIIENF